MLTEKQKNFCRYIVEGCNNGEAYKKAYNCNSNTSANVESTKLLKRDDITAYIKELEKPINNLLGNTQISARNKQIKDIEERIAICKQNKDENALIRYYDMLNKIYGLYKETEEEQKNDTNINSIDTTTLYKLSGVS